MARVTNAQLGQQIDDLTEAFREFKAEVKDAYEGVNGRQRDLITRVTKLETVKNPGEEKEVSRLEDPKVILALIGIINALIGALVILAQRGG